MKVLTATDLATLATLGSVLRPRNRPGATASARAWLGMRKEQTSQVLPPLSP